jgi:hypothetical protein
MAFVQSVPAEVWAIVFFYVSDPQDRLFEPMDVPTHLRLLCRSIRFGVEEWLRFGIEKVLKLDGTLWLGRHEEGPSYLCTRKLALLALCRAPDEVLWAATSLNNYFPYASRYDGSYRSCYPLDQSSLSFSELKNLKRIDGPFLKNVRGLQKVDLSHMMQLTEIGSGGFLWNSEVEEVRFPPNLAGAGDSFLRNLQTKRIDLSHTALEWVGRNFLSDSTVEEVLLPPTLKSLGTYFLENVRLRKLDLSHTKLETLGHQFLQCSQVDELLLPASLTDLGDGFLFSGTTTLLDLSHTAMKRIGSSCLDEGTVSVVILPETVESIDSGFLRMCRVNTIDLSRTSVLRVGSCFLHGAFFGELILPATLEGGEDAFLDFSTAKKIDMSRIGPKFSKWGFFRQQKNVLELVLPPHLRGNWKRLFKKGESGNVKVSFVNDNENDAEGTDVEESSSLVDQLCAVSTATSRHQGARRKRRRSL